MFGNDARDDQGSLPRRRLLTSGAALVPAALAVPLSAPAMPAGMPGTTSAPKAPSTKAPATPLRTTVADWRSVAEVFGRPGNLMRGLYYHTPFPRWDLSVVSEDVHISPGLALSSHASFAAYSDGCGLLMGDMVVPESGLERFLDDLQSAGIMVTAVHKHLLRQTPAMWWVHACAVSPKAATPSVAAGLKRALDRAGTPPPPRTQPSASKSTSKSTSPAPIDLDTAGIDAAFGARGTVNGDVYTTVFVRRETILEGGRVLPSGLGATTAINFQPVGGGRAAVSGDFSMTADEVQQALAALRRGGLELVSLHNHGLTDEPRLFFTHFWAVDDAVRIARAVHAALALTNVAPAML